MTEHHFTTFLLAVLLFCSPGMRAQDFSVPFAVYGTDTLRLDVYMPSDTAETHYCVVYTYGGGFMDNNQKAGSTKKFCRTLADDGYVVVATDYRLGLKGVKMKGVLSMVKPLRKAVDMAAEDVFKAVSLILSEADDWKLRRDGIVLCGSSAGAVTSLQCDYELCNRSPKTAGIPADFRFAGVISFAGAVYSDEGKCDFRVHNPSPVLLFHGMDDNLVTYDKIAFFNHRLSGSADLVKRYARYSRPYEIIRFRDEGHVVAARYLENYDEVTWFLDNMVKAGKHFEIDKTVYDRDRIRASWDKTEAKNLYKQP